MKQKFKNNKFSLKFNLTEMIEESNKNLEKEYMCKIAKETETTLLFPKIVIFMKECLKDITFETLCSMDNEYVNLQFLDAYNKHHHYNCNIYTVIEILQKHKIQFMTNITDY